MANEGTITHIETDDEGKFKMCFVAFGFMIRSFLTHMRPLLITYGAHLKGTYKGTNLVLVGMDGNNQIIPIATCVSQDSSVHTLSDWATHKVMDIMKKSANWKVYGIHQGKVYQVDDRQKNNTTDKLPILKLGEYEMWVIRIKQYFQTNKKNDVKARSLLLMDFPNEHQLTFSQYNDAKTMFAAIETQFRVWMNKADIETMSIDDLYNNFKIVEQDVKKSVGASTGAQNMAFMTAPSTSSTNDVNSANPAYEASTVSPNVNTASPQVSTANFSDNAVNGFKVAALSLKYKGKKVLSDDRKKIFIKANDTAGYDKSKVECFNCHKMGHFPRECRAQRNQDGQFKNQDNTRKHGNNEDTYLKAMLAINEPEFKSYGPRDSKLKSNIVHDKKSDDSKENSNDSFVKEQVSEVKSSFVESLLNVDKETAFSIDKKIEFVKPKHHDKPIRKSVRPQHVGFEELPDLMVHHLFSKDGKPQKDDKGFIDSGCSRHITRNITYLTDFKEFDRDYVTFRGGAHGGRISGKGALKTDSLDFKNVYFFNELKFNLFSVSQMCDKKNYVLFTDNECLVLSSNFKLPDESQILLKIPRKDNMYSFDMKNIVPKESLTCLVAKATLDESLLWHRRLGHINFKNINKLVNDNLVRDKKVKIIRCDNGIEFKNKAMDDFCREKGIKREYSVARTPQQNGVAERKNKTLIKAARTMVLIVKPHNKTPYKLFRGFKPILSFMRPFGCHVTILDTLDNLGKFNGKSDESFFVGYSLSGKAFRVYNTRTRKVEENLHIRSLENKPMKEGMVQRKEATSQDYIVMPIWKDASYFDSPSKDDEDGDDKDKSEDDSSPKEVNAAGKHVNTASLEVNTSRFELNTVDPSLNTASSSDPHSPTDMFKLGASDTLEATHVEFFSERDAPEVWILVDLPYGKKAIGTKWIFRNKKYERGIVIKNKARLVEHGHRKEEGIDYEEVFAPVERIEAIRLFLAYASFMGFLVYQMDVKSALLYGTIEEEVYVTQPPGFKDPNHQDKVYKVSKALYGMHHAPRAWYETLNNYLLSNAFQRGKIDPKLFIKNKKGDILLVQIYVDDIIFRSTNKELCIAFRKLMKDKFQMSSMGDLTFFLGLQVTQKDDGIFISQDKYPLVKDRDANDVDVHLYKSMIRSLMYLTASRPDIMFAVCACVRFQVTPKTSHLLAVKRFFRYQKSKPTLGLWYPRDSPFEIVAYTDSDYARATQDRKSTTGDEYVAVASCYGQVLWIQNQLLDYEYNFMNTNSNQTSVNQMANLEFCEQHNMVAFLKKPHGSTDFHQIVVFLNSTHIKYALTKNPVIYVSLIRQFWETASSSTSENGEIEITAIMDERVKYVTEASIKRHLKLEDYEGISNLRNTKIFEQLALIGYVSNSDRLTFQKGHFSPQWRFYIHTILHCLSPKKTAWEQFSSNIATAVICLATNRTFSFSKMIFEGMLKNLDNKSKFFMYPRFIQIFLNKHKKLLKPHKSTYVAPILTQKLVSNMRRASKGYSKVDVPLFPTMLVQSPIMQSDPTILPPPNSSPLRIKLKYSAAYSKLIMKIKKLKSKVKSHKARRRFRLIISKDEDDLEDPSKQGRKIAQIDEDEGITLVQMGAQT
nr:retrovirus-related Pol polyprotein from transposon TNT 1-94 [Tanacetum cinerariifolium]